MVLVHNLAANYLGQGWRVVMSLVFLPIYVNYLGIEAYGLIGMFALLLSWLALMDMGMKPALAREMARFTGGAHDSQSIWDLLRSIELVSIALASLLALAVWGGSGWLATDWVQPDKLSTDQVAGAFALMGVVTALSFVESLYSSSMAGLQRQVLQNIISSFFATIRGLGAVAILIWVSPSIKAFFLWQGCVSILSLAVSAAAVYHSLPGRTRRAQFSVEAIRGIWRYAAGMIGITFLSLLLTQVDKILLSKILSLKDFGFYALAGVVSGTLYTMITPVTGAFFPKFVELLAQKDEVAVRRAYHQAAQLIVVLMGSAAVVLAVYSSRVLQVWMGDAEVTQQVSPLLTVLAIGTLLNGLMWIPFQMLMAHGWTSLSLRMNGFAVLIVVPAIFYIVPQYGALGAAYIWVVLNGCCLVVGIDLMHRKILVGEKLTWYWRDVVVPLLTAGVTALLCSLLIPDLGKPLTEVLVIGTVSLTVLLATFFSAPRVRDPVLAFFIRSIKSYGD